MNRKQTQNNKTSIVKKKKKERKEHRQTARQTKQRNTECIDRQTGDYEISREYKHRIIKQVR